MGIYHFSAKIIQRSKGRSAIAAAAYRAASALHDESLGRTFNYLGKTGVIHSEILLPEGAPARWKDRELLWNEVEQVERRKDAGLAREIEIALPRELSQAEAIQLARDFVREQFVSRGMVADLNIHWGHSADGEAQPHAHIMLTMRRVVPGPAGRPEEGAFGLKERAWNETALLLGWRARWAEMANARLAEIGVDARIDHRSNAAQGIDLEPQNKIGPAGARRAVRGEDAERADEHREIARRNGEKLLAGPELALQVLTQQQSTFTRADLARLVHRHSDGAAQFAAIMAKVEASPELVRVGKDGRERERYSTREMVQIERRMESTALELSRRKTHAVAADRRRALLASTTLGAEQQLAFGHMTRSRDLAVVVGYAGSGKSTVLGPTRQAWEAEGYSVRGAALSGIAVEGLEGGSGIPSRTIASWELAWARGKEQLGPRDVLVLDEAGMVGSRQMERVLSAVRQAGAKLVLVGDHEQLQAIEAGAAFRAIVERVGAAEITEVFRQYEPWQREATKELARGKTAEALARYEQAGMVRARATDEAARVALIAEWQKARGRAPEESHIILAHSRAEVRALNEAARDLRRVNGELGEDQLLPTESGLRRFATGDRVYFLRNEIGLGVKNGTLGTITGIEGEGQAARLAVRLDREDPKTGEQKRVAFRLAEYAHLDHGYAATVHKSQSVTVDRTHVLATPGMDRHLAYVALSRHRQSVTLHWSRESFRSSEGLVARLSRERAKDTTLDYGESDEEVFAAYAERRGLQPAAPKGDTVVPAPGHPSVTAWARLRRVGLATEIRTALVALRQVVEAQKAAITGIAEMLKSRQAPKPRPVIVETGKAESQSAPAPTAVPSLTAMLDDYVARQEQENARKPPAPMLPAIPERLVTEQEVAALAGEPVKLRDHLKSYLTKAYRDPAAAWAQLDALLQAHGSEDKVAVVLGQKGPETLGKLRGKEGMFASEKAWQERWEAERAAKAIPTELTQPREMHRKLLERYRIELEAKRSRETIAVPALTPEALGAVERLRQAGATPESMYFDTPAGALSPYEIKRASDVGPVWASIQSDNALAKEIAAFRKAGASRVGNTPDLKDPATRKVYGLLQILDHAEQQGGRHQALKEIRISQERDEAVRAEAARASEEARQRVIKQAKSRPRFSGPGMG
jgi:Ti-type conjugative transfer relaxase TraA